MPSRESSEETGNELREMEHRQRIDALSRLARTKTGEQAADDPVLIQQTRVGSRRRVQSIWRLGLAILATCAVLLGSVALYANFRHGGTARRAASTGHANTQTLREFALPEPGSRPVSITQGPDGNLWFSEETGVLGRVTPAGK
jgi:hypothetical protein